MKKLTLFAATVAAIALASCGGNKSAQTTEPSAEKTFEQEQIEASIKLNFDSLAAEISRLKQLPVVSKDGAITLTDEEKQVKPDYLLEPTAAENAVTLSEKYRTLTALEVDRQIAELYEMPTDSYDQAIAKLAADINDPSFQVVDGAGHFYETSQALYDAMSENGRINYFWQIVSMGMVEQLFAVSQNTEKFVAAFDDDAAANVSMRIILIQDAINRLTQYDPELEPVAEAIDPLKVIDAITVDDFKAQLIDAKEQITAARQALVGQ